MIENDRQYEITKQRLSGINKDIENVNSDTNQHPLRNKLMRATLINAKKDLEEEISLYESSKTESSN